MKQESFQIGEDIAPRKKIIRQDRIPVAVGRCFIFIDQFQLEIVNVSAFGVACVIRESDFHKIESLSKTKEFYKIPIAYNNIETQQLHLRLVREEVLQNSVNGERIVGFEVVGEELNVERIRALEMTADVLSEQEKSLKLAGEIPNDFKLVTYEMREWLSSLKIKIDEIEKSVPVDNAAKGLEFRETVADAISDYLNLVLPAKYKHIPKLLEGRSPAAVEAATKFMREQVGAFVYGAPFAFRAYSKPRGYAGDYEMMNHLYRDERVGKSLFDQCMHKYFIDEPAGVAVKNRGRYLLEKIKTVVARSSSKKIRILAVASGPAMEQQLFLKEVTHNTGKEIEFVCIDQDEESLKHAQRQIQSADRFIKSGHTFRFVNLAIKNIIGRGLPEKNFDLIYTAGLFDYFTDPVAQLTATKLFEGLAPGGELVIGNFSKDNPSVAFMEMVLDWHLIYRSVEDLHKLFGGIDKQMVVEDEPLKINLFACLKNGK